VQLSTKSAQDNVGVINPTGLGVTGLQAAVGADGAVVVAWATANEANVLGFQVLRRAVGGGAYEVLTPDLIAAAQAGANQGSDYQYVDADAPVGTWEYALAVLLLDGRTEQIGPVQVVK
jgi:hypothetical protein